MNLSDPLPRDLHPRKREKYARLRQMIAEATMLKGEARVAAEARIKELVKELESETNE